MSESSRNVCKIFVDNNQEKVPMIAMVKVSEKANFEKVLAVGEEEIVGIVESGHYFEITLSLFCERDFFDRHETFDLTIDYGQKFEKYRSCTVTEKQKVADTDESFWKQKIVIVSLKRE